MTRFKYNGHLEGCPDQPCPCSRYQERERVAYRWVHATPTNDDFLPPALTPQPGQARPKTARCSDYALSFFATPQAAKKRLASLADSYDVYALFGTHAIEIKILTSDGQCSEPNRRWKHLDLHEYDIDHGWLARCGFLHPMCPEE